MDNKYYCYNYEFIQFKESALYRYASSDHQLAMDNLMKIYGDKNLLGTSSPDEGTKASDGRRRTIDYIDEHLDDITVLDEYELITLSHLMQVSESRVRFVSDVISMMNRMNSYSRNTEENEENND